MFVQPILLHVLLKGKLIPLYPVKMILWSVLTFLWPVVQPELVSYCIL